MEPSIHMFAWGDRNPLTYHRQVPGVKRLVVDLGGAPGQIHERVWIDHVLNELAEVGLGLSVVESFFVSNAIKLELSERDQHVEAFCPVCMARISILVMDWQHGRRDSSICRLFWLGRQS